MNNNAFDFFASMAQNNPTEKDVKISKNGASDFSQLDANFILKYVNKDSTILDLGSGTGLVINKLHDKVRKVTAVEPFENFTKYIIQDSNIEIINKNILDYSTTQEFDVITLFGIIQYFSLAESKLIYQKYFSNLKKDGKIIIKNQFGVNDDVTIEGFSEELQKNYYSQYRYYKAEMLLLEQIGYKNVQFIDIYPPECNRWNNTHFYALVAEK